MTSQTTPRPQSPNPHAQRAQRLLEYTASRAPYGCRLPELAAVEFGPHQRVSDGALKDLRDSLNRLVRKGRLIVRGDGLTQCWYYAQEGQTPAPAIAPPREVQVMSGHYIPTLWQPGRAGALEHMNWPSRRGEVRVAYRGGYVRG